MELEVRKDQKLYTAFLELGKLILETLDEKTDNSIKELFFELSESGISKIFKKHFGSILDSTQYKNFEKLLMNNENYSKNFKIPVGTSDAQYKMKIDFFVEHIFLDYLKNNGITWNQELANQYYDNIENFLIDDTITVTVTTPLVGLKADNKIFKIEDEIIISHIQKQRRLDIFSGLQSLQHAVANYDLIFQFTTKKIYQEESNEKEQKSNVKKSKTIIQNLMMALRLYHSGKIGFLDSIHSLSIYVGSIHWQNPRCGLPDYWESWITPSYIFNENDIEEVKKLRIEISKLINRNGTDFLFRSIDRFMISYEQDRIEDRILDLIISLESLLLPEMDELRFKLSMRTAKFLGKTPEDRNRIYKAILAAYKIRSETAHGTSLHYANLQRVMIGTEELTLETLAERVEEYVRIAIKQMIILLNQGENLNSIKRRLDDSLFLEGS